MNQIPPALNVLRNFTRILASLPKGKNVTKIIRRKFATNTTDYIIPDFLGRSKITVNLSDHIGSQIFWNGQYSTAVMNVAKKYIKSGDVVFDIGANIGEFTVFAKGLAAQVYAFEPVQKLHGIVQSNIEINQFNNVYVHKIGFYDKAEKRPIYLAESLGEDATVNEGLNSLFPRKELTATEETDLVRMDDWCIENSIEKIDFIKMDIEGAELFALQGGEESIKKFKPRMIIEVNDQICERAGYTPEELVDLITGWGYKAYGINRKSQMVEFDIKKIVYRDVLFLPQ